MTDDTKKKLYTSIVVVGMCIVLAFSDWEYFFPLSAHSDLRFQLIGELLEAIAVFGIIAAFFMAIIRQPKPFTPLRPSPLGRLLCGVGYVVIVLAMGWRHFFPHDQFDFGSGTDELLGTLFVGVIMTIWGFNSPGNNARPDAQHEKSVV